MSSFPIQFTFTADSVSTPADTASLAIDAADNNPKESGPATMSDKATQVHADSVGDKQVPLPAVASHIGTNNSISMRKYTGRLACDRMQCPKVGPFSSDDLTWFNESAWIPETRLQDFIDGEEHRHNFNTIFKIRSTEVLFCKATGNKLKTVRRFWCTFGPVDLRKQVIPTLPDARKLVNGKVPLRHTTLTGLSVNRGCRSHFHVTRFQNRSHAVQITWVSRKHCDTAGRICHGLLDRTARQANAHVAPRLSTRTRQFVERLIRTGVSTREIVRAHFRNIRNHWRDFCPNEKDPGKVWSRDMMLNSKSVHTIRQNLLRKKIDYGTDDHLAVDTWVANNKEKVFLYQKKTDTDPFLLAWATEWQIDKAATLGHGRTVAMDATFGTNVWDLSLHTVMAYDDFHNGLPVAWALMEKSKSEHLILFLEALKKRVTEHRASLLLDPDWRPIAFIIDVASEEILSLRLVFPGIPILLCLWHVRRAWTKNLMSKVKDVFNRAAMNRDLGHLMYGHAEDPNGASEIFMSMWNSSESTFVAYFRTYWHPRLERWMKKFRNYDHQNQNTNGAIERWHHTMKMHLRTEKATKQGRSIVWLLGMLTDDMELFYWCMLSLKFQGAIRNTVKEAYVWASIHKARNIADTQVRFLEVGVDGICRAEVTTYKPNCTPNSYIVTNYKQDNATCTCGHSEQGNTCKHQIKVLLLEGYSETELFNLLGSKWGSCCGGLEYAAEILPEESCAENDVVNTGPPEEVDISFPLKTFASLAEEPEPGDMDSYHEYNLEYYLGLVRSGWDHFEKLPAQVRNQAVVKLQKWVQWVGNQEACADPPELDQFPLTPFVRPEGATNSLKRRKDLVEIIWGKKKRGPLKGSVKPKSALPGGDDRQNVSTSMVVDEKSLQGWEKVALAKRAVPKVFEGENGCSMNETNVCHAAQDQENTDSASERGEDKALAPKPPLPFEKKTKVKESDQQKLDRLARESLNLSNEAMDYEAASPPKSEVVTAGKPKNVGRKISKKVLLSKAPNVCVPSGTTQSSMNGAPSTAPKRRGRPLGSKNKPKAVTNVGSTVKASGVLGSLPHNLTPSLAVTYHGLPVTQGKENFVNSCADSMKRVQEGEWQRPTVSWMPFGTGQSVNSNSAGETCLSVLMSSNTVGTPYVGYDISSMRRTCSVAQSQDSREFIVRIDED